MRLAPASTQLPTLKDQCTTTSGFDASSFARRVLEAKVAIGHYDSGARDPDVTAAHTHLDPARSSHRMTLLDDDHRAILDDTPCPQIAGKRAGGAARSRVLPNVNRRVEEPGVSYRCRIERLKAE